MSAKNWLGAAVIAVVGFGSGACAIDADGDPEPDQRHTGTIEQAVAPVPQDFAGMVVSSTRISLSWTAVPGATKYILLKGPSMGTEVTFTTLPGAATSYVNGHIDPGETTCWQLKSVVAGEISAPTASVCLTTPAAPGPPNDVDANATATDRIVLTWSAIVGATKYYVFRSLDANGVYTQIGTALAVANPSFTAGSLQPSTTYFFRVQTQFSGGVSIQSDPPASATTFSVGTEGYWKFDEDAGAVANDSSGLGRTGSLTGAAAFSNTKAPIVDNKSAVLFPGAAGDAVSVPNVSAWNLAGDFTVALWVRFPVTPGDGTVRIIGKRRSGCNASAAWEIAQDAGNGLHVKGSATLPFNTTVPVDAYTHLAVTRTAGVARTYVNGVQTNSGAYSVGASNTDPLQIGNSGGCGSAIAFLVDDVLILTRAMTTNEVGVIGTRPPAPTNLVGTVVSPTAIQLSWNPVANADKYLIYKGTVSGDETLLTSYPAATTEYLNGHLSPGEQSSWQVAVARAGLISEPSNEVILITDPPPPAPTGLTATAVSSSRIDLSWNGVAGASKYFVYESISNGPFSFRGTALMTTFSAIGLAANTLYTYKVRAVSGDDNKTESADSDPASATTLP